MLNRQRRFSFAVIDSEFGHAEKPATVKDYLAALPVER